MKWHLIVTHGYQIDEKSVLGLSCAAGWSWTLKIDSLVSQRSPLVGYIVGYC